MNKIIKFIIFVLITIYLAICLVSCSPTKKATTTENKKEETTIVHDTVTVKEVDTIHVTKTETKIETKTDIQFDTIVNGCPENKVIYRSNGDIEATGNVKSVNLNNFVSRQQYDSLRVHNEEEKASRFYWQSLAEENKKETTVKKHSGVKIFFLGFMLGAILMFLLLLWLNKRKSIIKHI